MMHRLLPSRVQAFTPMADNYPNWFAHSAIYNFEQFLIPLAGVDNLHFMQLGVFTGDASVWLCEKVLTGEKTRLYDVDTWEGSDELAHKSMDFVSVYDTYRAKTDHYPQIFKVANNTKDHLRLNYLAFKNSMDFIYIDADHTTVGVLVDAELSWDWLKSGGIMAFDDYTWHHESGEPRLEPRAGIDLFLHRHKQEYEVLTVNTQVWIKKK
jgi:predicted O-methyltransferase YrrM